MKLFLYRSHNSCGKYIERSLYVFFALIITIFSGCTSASPRLPFDAVEYRVYNEIPNITDEEIEAIEQLRARNAEFLFGMPDGVACFRQEDGALNGYSALLSAWLSDFFGLTITPALYEWDALVRGVNTREISFSGAFPASQSSGRFTTDPIAERTMVMVMRGNSESLSEIGRRRRPVFGFIEGAGVDHVISSNYKQPYAIEWFPTYAKAYDGLMNQKIDVIILDRDAEDIFAGYENVKLEPFIPSIHDMVTLATADPELAPIISIVQKYIENGGAHKLADLNSEGRMVYLRNKLYKTLDDSEREFMRIHQHPAAVIPIAYSPDDYPNCFYNETVNEWQGIAPDILKQIGIITGFTFLSANTKSQPWSEVLEMLENGTVALTGELIRTPERENRFIWADASYKTDYYALLSSIDFPDVNTGQVHHMRVGLLAGTAYAELFFDLFPGHRNTVLYATNHEVFTALANGEIDLFMATRDLLLNATNYMERTGFKANLVLSRSFESKFGFNLQQGTLCSIVSKAQSLVDTESITDRWVRRVFDYRGQMARSQLPYLFVASTSLALLLVLLSAFFIRNRHMGRRLEQTVYERTQELQLRTSELEAQTRTAEIASKAKSEFLARMSHEIRTPLNAIIGMTRIAANSVDNDNKKTISSLNEISTASDHLLGILNDVLDMSKIESGMFVLSEEAFELRTAMMEVRNIIGQRCAEHNLAFSVNFETMPNCVLLGDKLRLKQVLINLLGNSVKFTPDNGTISFHVDILSEDDLSVACRFSVTDNGIGMTRAQIDKLFVAFEQADESISRRFGGTGLGLAISQTLVGHMGGVIQVRSEPGKGSTFSFAITMRKAVFEDKVERTDEAPLDLTGKRILVVDDVDINRIILTEILAETNAATEEARNGQEALDMFFNAPQNHFDFIFMDVQMPVIDGYQATATLRASDRPDAKNIPIVAMTANAYREDIERALESGMNAHLAKPINFNELKSMLRSFLDSINV